MAKIVLTKTFDVARQMQRQDEGPRFFFCWHDMEFQTFDKIET